MSNCFFSRRQSRSPVRYIDDHRLVVYPGADRQAARFCVLDGVLQQIDEDFFNEETIQRDEGQVRRQLDLYLPPLQTFVERISATPIGSSNGCHSFCTTRV